LSSIFTVTVVQSSLNFELRSQQVRAQFVSCQGKSGSVSAFGSSRVSHQRGRAPFKSTSRARKRMVISAWSKSVIPGPPIDVTRRCASNHSRPMPDQEYLATSSRRRPAFFRQASKMPTALGHSSCQRCMWSPRWPAAHGVRTTQAATMSLFIIDARNVFCPSGDPDGIARSKFAAKLRLANLKNGNLCGSVLL
jgi:hypothetical protein